MNLSNTPPPLTAEQQRLIRLGKAVDEIKFNDLAVRSHRRDGWDDCIRAIRERAARAERSREA